MSEVVRRKRRTDADRSAGAIVRAAIRILATQPNASVEEIATAASVSRQTVYAHFKSREGVLSAVLDAISAETVAEMDAVDLDEGSAADALIRLLDASWLTAQRYSLLLNAVLLTSPDPSPAADRLRHIPVMGYLEKVLTRGRESGEFHDELPVAWLATSIVALGHTAGQAAATGRMTFEQAADVLARSVLRLCEA